MVYLFRQEYKDVPIIFSRGFLNMYRTLLFKVGLWFVIYFFFFSDIQMELDICSYEESANFIWILNQVSTQK